MAAETLDSTNQPTGFHHVPVMLAEVLETLRPAEGDVVCDCTLGGAGHSAEMGKTIGREGLLIGIDQDDLALTNAAARRCRVWTASCSIWA